jgi:hypothetical protein
VHYDIRGALDWPKKTFHGRMTLAWRNTGAAPTQEMPLHLWLNSLRPQGAPAKPGAGAGAGAGASVGTGCQIKSVKSGGEALAHETGKGGAVCLVRLPAPVAPGGAAAIDVEWEAVFPEMQLGCGWADGFLVASNWYPRLGLYRGDCWADGPPDPMGAPPGHFGDYDVELSLPNALQLANTGMVLAPLDGSGRPARDRLGREVEAVQDPARRLNFLYKIRAENVQDFSWIATPNGSWRLSRLDWGDTQVFIYGLPKNGSQARRLREAIKSALRFAEDRLAPYPYPVLSVVDLPAGALEGGAVSAPMLAAVSNVSFDPYGQRFVPEQTTIRQLGDQLFRWAVAAEGPGGKLHGDLAEWFTDKVMDGDYPRTISSRRFTADAWLGPWRRARVLFPRLPFFPLRHLQRPPAPGPGASAPLSRLEALIGGDAMEGAVRSYLAENALRASGGGAFRAAAERASGTDLRAFWEARMEGAGAIDYRIRGVGTAQGGRGAVTLERVGAAAPITLRVITKDGREASQAWDGRDRLATLHFGGPIAEAALDPEGRYPELKGGLRTTWAAAPRRRGLLYWASMASGALCGLLQGAGVG